MERRHRRRARRSAARTRRRARRRTRASFASSSRGQRLEDAQHQRVDRRAVSLAASADRRPPARSAAGGRESTALSTSARSAGSRSEIFARQHVAFAHVGDVARLALVEADQHAALLRHVAHRQPRAIPVAPRRPVDRRQQTAGRTRPMRASASSSARCLAATCSDGVRVLQRAAAADAEVRAARHRRATRWPRCIATARAIS